MNVAAAPVDPDYSPLTDLPDEIWRLILKKLPQKDILNLRLVSNEVNIKSTYLYEDWDIRLDEKCPYLEMMLDLRVKKVKVIDLHRSPSFRRPGILFKYPNNIQTLSTSVFMSTLNEHILLQYKNLTTISLQLCDYSTFYQPMDPRITYNFPEVHTLKMDIEISGDHNEHLQQGSLIHRILIMSKIPKLTSFQIKCRPLNQETIYKVSMILLSFLGREGQNLKRLCYKNIGETEDYDYTGLPPLNDATVLKYLTSLETLKLSPSWINEPLNGTWTRLIKNQKNLVDIFLDQCFVITSPLCKEITEKNFKTLTSVKINSLTFAGGRMRDDNAGEFDASMFQNCSKLIGLKLSDLHHYYTDPFIPHEDDMNDHELINLQSLPNQIEKLMMTRFLGDSEDILNFLITHPFVSNLSIQSTDLDASILESVLAHEDLVSVHLRWIDVPKSRLKLTRLKGIYNKLNCPTVDGQFDFDSGLLITRASLTADWQAVYIPYEDECDLYKDSDFDIE